MKKTLLSHLTALVPAFPIILSTAGAADVFKNNTTGALNTAGSWATAVPTATDVAVWDSAVTAPNSSAIGGAMSWGGIRIGAVGGARNTTTNFITIAATGTNALTLGASGIDMSAALQALRIQSNVTVSANQTWNISDANTNGGPLGLNRGEDLGFVAPGAGTVLDFGGFTVNKTGVGVVDFATGITLANTGGTGALNINGGTVVIQSGSSRVTTVNAGVNLNINNTGTLAFGSESGLGGVAVNSAASINMATGGTLVYQLNQNNTVNQTGNITMNGAGIWRVAPTASAPAFTTALCTFSGNLLGSGAVNYANIQTQTGGFLRMTGNNSAYSGTFTLDGTAGNRILRLAGANAGSAAATWAINAGNIIQLDGVSVNLGTLNGAGNLTTSAVGTSTATIGAGTFTGTLTDGIGFGPLALTKNTTGTLTLTGANTYTGATQVNAGTLITTPAQTGSTTVDVAAAGTFGVRPATLGTPFGTGTLTTAASGATLLFDNTSLANPTAAMINAATFNPATGTILKVTGTNFTAGTFPLVDYTTIGGGGYAGLSANLPYRLVANLVDNTGNTSVDLQVFGNETPKWAGNLSANWDVDDGTPTGTQNWKTAFTNTTTRYLQNSPNGTDAVIFDDSAAGNFNVNLTTTLTPQSVTVNNSANSYTFSGTGKLSGTGGITKTGNGTLTIANTTANDYSGGTQINAGTVQVGDGVTAGAGSLGTGPVAVNATLNVNRQGGLTIPGAVTGTGSIVLNNNLATTGGGNFGGVISGPGNFANSGGTLQLSGAAANIWSGTTTITAGQLQLNKTAGVNAVPGDITISGTGQLAILSGEQIPNTATITFTGTSTDSIPTQSAVDTVANVIVNSTTGGSAGGQVILKNGLTISGTGTVNSGILGVASSSSGNVGGINITSAPGSAAIVRVAGSGGASILNVGAGGITASGGEIQVKFNTNAQDATLNLGGNFTTTGNVIITNGGYTGTANLNVINLTATRTFNIGAGTTTTVAPDFGGPGGLTKTGNGILALTTTSNAAHTGITTISQGTLSLAGAASISLSPKIIVQAGATFDVSAASPAFSLAAGQTLGGKGTITGPITLNASSVLSPGESPGTLTFNGNLNITAAVAGSATGSMVFELDTPGTSDQVLLGPTATLTIGAGGLEFDDFSFSALGGFGPGTYVLFDTAQSVSGTLGAAVTGTVGGYDATLGFAGTNDLVLTVVPEPGSAVLGFTGLLFLVRRRRAA